MWLMNQTGNNMLYLRIKGAQTHAERFVRRNFHGVSLYAAAKNKDNSLCINGKNGFSLRGTFGF